MKRSWTGYSENLRFLIETELEEVIGNFGPTLPGKDKHAITGHSKGKVAASRGDVSFLVNLKTQSLFYSKVGYGKRKCNCHIFCRVVFLNEPSRIREGTNTVIRDCSEFLFGLGVVLFWKSARKKCVNLVRNGYPPTPAKVPSLPLREILNSP